MNDVCVACAHSGRVSWERRLLHRLAGASVALGGGRRSARAAPLTRPSRGAPIREGRGRNRGVSGRRGAEVAEDALDDGVFFDLRDQAESRAARARALEDIEVDPPS